jgi:hypothetical protein
MKQGEIIMYQPDDSIRLEVRMEEETVWLNRQQMAMLFDRDVKTIGRHVNNALKEELSDIPVVANFATTAKDGKTYQVEYYNLDMILSVGYRVKSKRGIEFRRWANSVLKEYLLRGYAINQRFERLERRVTEHDAVLSEHSNKLEFFVRAALPPKEGVFYDGQIFDAYAFASELIKSARQRIVLVDNYIDESVLLMLAKRNEGVTAEIVTRQTNRTLALDIDRHNRQYPPITIRKSARYHDRFLIVDDTVYHIGASLKDLGKKLFAFSKMELAAHEIGIE